MYVGTATCLALIFPFFSSLQLPPLSSCEWGGWERGGTPTGLFKLTSITNLRKRNVTFTYVVYSNDLFVFKAECVTLISLKVPSGTHYILPCIVLVFLPDRERERKRARQTVGGRGGGNQPFMPASSDLPKLFFNFFFLKNGNVFLLKIFL